MSFTGEIGTQDSQLGNIELGVSGTPSQAIQIKASIRNTVTQTIQIKASIRNTVNQSISAKARIMHSSTISCKARIMGQLRDISCKARIVGIITASLEVDYNVLVAVKERLAVQFQSGDASALGQQISCKARIKAPITSRLGITYAVDYNMPDLPVVRPTQRIIARSIRTISMRARIS